MKVTVLPRQESPQGVHVIANTNLPRNIEGLLFGSIAWDELQAGRPDGAIICLNAIIDNMGNSRQARAQATIARAAIERHCPELIEQRIRELKVCPEALGGRWTAMMAEWHRIREAATT